MAKKETTIDVPPGLLEVHSESFSVSSTVRSVESGIASESEVNKQVEKHDLVSFTVQGIYTRWDPTPEEEATKKREFICRRRRLYTRPLFEEESDDDSSSSDDEDERNSEADSEDDSDDEDSYETAMFIPKVGLVGVEFWHEYDTEAKVIREDRAVLFQSQENYERILSHDQFKVCFEGIDYMERPTFGEQVIVNGVDVSDLAIGDVFEIEGRHSPLVVEITAPRKPCSYMNQSHGTCNGKRGFQNFSHHNNLAGWFARVLVAGELREKMKFIRKAHPNPKWTLTYIHKALYGEGNRLESMMNISSWNRDRKELEELIALPQLGEYEWKAEGRRRLYKFDGIDWKTVRKDIIDPQCKMPNFFLQFYLISAIVETLTAALKQFGIL